MTREYLPPAEAHYSQLHWLDELDMLGSSGPLERYEAHLAKAPLPTHYDVGFLAGYVASQRLMSIATRRVRRRQPVKQTP